VPKSAIYTLKFDVCCAVLFALISRTRIFLGFKSMFVMFEWR
jgi:hypothetical protein